MSAHPCALLNSVRWSTVLIFRGSTTDDSRLLIREVCCCVVLEQQGSVGDFQLYPSLQQHLCPRRVSTRINSKYEQMSPVSHSTSMSQYHCRVRFWNVAVLVSYIKPRQSDTTKNQYSWIGPQQTHTNNQFFNEPKRLHIYDKSETPYEKLSMRRIQICLVHFCVIHFDLFFSITFQITSRQKQSRKSQIRLVKYSGAKVSDLSESPWSVREFFSF